MRSLLIRPIQAGFTLVELLIVVIILAVLAAIVVPQFTSATLDAKEAALDANLAAIRSAIELYQAQHNGKYPAGTAATGGACVGKGTGPINTEQAFKDHLLMYSDAAGNTCNLGDSTFKYGPYLRKGIPADPIYGVATVTPSTAGTPLTSAANPGGGWLYDTRSGQFVMNSVVPDSKAVEYYKH